MKYYFQDRQVPPRYGKYIYHSLSHSKLFLYSKRNVDECRQMLSRVDKSYYKKILYRVYKKYVHVFLVILTLGKI